MPNGLLVPIADRVGRELYRERDPLFPRTRYDEAWPALSLLEDAKASTRWSG